MMKYSLPILLYHHIAPEWEIQPADFEKHLIFLRKNNYQTIFVTDFIDCLKGKKEIDWPAVAITFDDGYYDNWHYVFPLLKKYQVKATIFVVTGKIKEERSYLPDPRKEEWVPDNFLTWKEMKEMVVSGLVSIQSHTHTHRDFQETKPYHNLAEELSLSKNLIEQNLNQTCSVISWPWGEYSSGMIKAARECGYLAAVTTKVGANLPATDPFRIKRFKVAKANLSWFRQRISLYTHPFWARLYGFLRP